MIVVKELKWRVCICLIRPSNGCCIQGFRGKNAFHVKRVLIDVAPIVFVRNDITDNLI